MQEEPKEYPYNMTQYWEMLQNDMLALQEEVFFKTYPPVVSALKMVEKGLLFEAKKTKIAELTPLMDGIIEDAKGLGPEKSITATIDVAGKQIEKTHQYHLPEIQDKNSLLFAICYLKHLKRFAEHTYDGPFAKSIWYKLIKSQIDAMTDNKRPWSKAQADFLEAQVLEYTATEKLSLTQSDLMPQTDTTTSFDFIKALKQKIFTQALEEADTSPSLDTVQTAEKEEVKDPTLHFLHTVLEEKETLLKEAKCALKFFEQLIEARNEAQKAYTHANRAFQRTPGVIKGWNALTKAPSPHIALKASYDEKEKAVQEALKESSEALEIRTLKERVSKAENIYSQAFHAYREKEASCHPPKEEETAPKTPHKTSSDNLKGRPQGQTPATSDLTFFGGVLTQNGFLEAGLVAATSMAVGFFI